VEFAAGSLVEFVELQLAGLGVDLGHSRLLQCFRWGTIPAIRDGGVEAAK
jgi:hypothetical protein